MFGRHPRAQLIDELNHPLRLSIMAAVGAAKQLPYLELRDIVEVDNPTLSKQLTILEAAGLLERQRWGGSQGSYVVVIATAAGRRACSQHVAALREIVSANFETPEGTPDEGAPR